MRKLTAVNRSILKITLDLVTPHPKTKNTYTENFINIGSNNQIYTFPAPTSCSFLSYAVPRSVTFIYNKWVRIINVTCWELLSFKGTSIGVVYKCLFFTSKGKMFTIIADSSQLDKITPKSSLPLARLTLQSGGGPLVD